MRLWWCLAIVMGCSGGESPPEGEAPAGCSDAALQTKAQVLAWARDAPPGPPMPDAERLSRLPVAGAGDTLPEVGHTIIYDTEHPSGLPVWLMNQRPIAEPGALPDLNKLMEAMADLDAREMGKPAPLVIHIPAAAPLVPVLSVLRPLADNGWSQWQVMRVTPAGRTLEPKPPAPAGIDAELEAMSQASPMGPGGALRSQAALRRLFMDIQSAGCDTSALDSLVRDRREAPEAGQVWTGLLDAWEACGCAVDAERVAYLSHQALAEHGMRHLVAAHLTIGDGEPIGEVGTWGELVAAAQGKEVVRLP